MTECERVEEVVRGKSIDEAHVRECAECSEAFKAHRFFRALAAADDLSPVLPDPRVLVLKAELISRRIEIRSEADRTRLTGVAVWAAIAAIWLTLLTWKLGEIQAMLEKFHLLPALPGGATAILVATVGGLIAFTVFAVAIHSVLAEL